MDDKLIGIGVKGRSSLKGCHVTAMAKLSLAVVAQNFVPLNKVVPICALLIVALVINNECKHGHVHANRYQPLKVVEPPVVRVLG